MKSAGKARNNGLYRHIRTSKEIIRNLLNDLYNHTIAPLPIFVNYFFKKVFYLCFFFNTRFFYSFLMFFRLPPYFFHIRCFLF